MYNDNQNSTLAQAKAKKLKAMTAKGTLELPPDKDSIRQHLLRAIYQAKTWHDVESASAPEDLQHYGYTFNGQYLLSVCHTKLACPDVLQNLNADESNSDSGSDSDSSDEDLCQSKKPMMLIKVKYDRCLQYFTIIYIYYILT